MTAHGFLQDRIRKLDRGSGRISTLRLVLFALALSLATWAALGRAPAILYSAAALSLVGFVVLVRVHDRWETALDRIRTRVALLARERAVRSLEWRGLEPLPLIPPGLDAPGYFSDLDIIGDRSILRLSNLTVSTRGWRRLLDIFANNAVTDEEVARRERVVSELIRARGLRKRFFVLTRSVERRFGGAIDSDALETLLEHSFAKPSAKTLLLGMIAFQACALILFAQGNRAFWIPGAVVCLGHLIARRHAHLLHAYEHAISISLSMDRFKAATLPLERWAQRNPAPGGQAGSSGLSKLLEPFRGNRAASRQIARLDRIAGMLGVRQNFVAYLLIHLLFPWELFWTLRLERLRAELASLLPRWQESLADFEAFASVAEFASLQKEWHPAELGAEILRASDLRHPLLPADSAVGNDLELSSELRCVLITGSNMSGKSTFLRAVGLGLVLAKTGSPVPARKFVFSNFPLYTAIRVNDSVQDGISSFYAEVRRLKEVLDSAQAGERCFYLLDEIFRGTNNRERFIGSQAYLKALTTTEAVGLVTTHDLELANLEGAARGLANFHFREEIRGSEMNFSYRKIRGPSSSTNALRVMQLSGLPIE